MSDVAQDIRTNIIFNAQNAIRNASALYDALQKVSTVDFSRVADNLAVLERTLSDVAFHAKEMSSLGKSVNNFAKNYKAFDGVEKSMRSASKSTANFGSEQENLLQRQKRIVAEMVNIFSKDRNFDLEPMLRRLSIVNSKIAKMYLNMRQLGQAKRAIEDAITIAGSPRAEEHGLTLRYQEILRQMNDAKARLQQYQYDVDYNGTRSRVDKYQARLETLMANRNNPDQNFLDAAINMQRRQEKSFVAIEQKMMNELARLKFDRDSGKTLPQHELDARTQRIYNYAQRLQSLIDGGKIFDGQKFPIFPVVDQMLAQIKSGLKSITGEQKKQLEDQKTQTKIEEKKARQQQKEYETFEKSISPLLDRVNRLKNLIDSKNSRGELFSQKQLDSINSQKSSLAQKLSDLTGKDYKKLLDQWIPKPLTGIKESESQLQYAQKVRSALQKKADKQTADEQKQIAQYYKDLNRLEQKILDIRTEINRKNSRGELFSQKELDRYSDTLAKIKSQLQSLTGSNEHSKIIDAIMPKPKTGTIEQERALNARIQAELALQKKQDKAEEKARKQKLRDEARAQKELDRLDNQRERSLQYEQSTRSAIQRAQDKEAQKAKKLEEIQANQRERALQYEDSIYSKLRRLQERQEEKARKDKEKADNLARSNEEKALNETIRINSKLDQLKDKAAKKAEQDKLKAAKDEESLNQKRLNHLSQLEKKARQVAEILARINDKKSTGGLFSIAEINRAQRQINRLVDDMNRISSVDLRPVITSEFNKSISGIQFKPKDQKIIDNSLATQLENARKKALECASALENNRSIANQLTFMKSLNELRNLEKQAGNVNKRLEKTLNLFENIGELVSKRMTWYFGDYLASMIYELPVEFIQRYRDLEQAMAGVQQVMPLIEHNQAELNKEMSEFLEISHTYAQDAATVIEAGQLWGRGYGKGVLTNQINDAIDAGLIEQMNQEMIDYASSAEAVKTSNELVAQSAMLATVDNFSLIESVKGLEAVLAAYGLRAESAAEATLYVGRAVDIITKVAHYGQISAQDLVRGIEMTGAAAAEAGISLEFLSAMIETGVRNTGLSGSNIGNAIKAFTASVYNPKATKELAKFGISNTFIDEDGIKRARNAQEIILEISEALVKGDQNAHDLIYTLSGGRMQANKILQILKDPAEILRMWGESIDSAGFAQEQLEVQMQTLNAHIKQLKSNFDSLINAVMSGSVSNNLKKFVDMFASGIKLVEDNLNGLKSVLLAFIAVKFVQFGMSFVSSMQRMLVATKAFSLELQRAGLANSTMFGLLKSGVAETGRRAISTFTSGNFNATKQMQDSINQLKNLQNQDTASKTANTAATVANTTATNANTASRAANSTAVVSNQASKVANTAATNALTAAELRQAAVSTIATAGLNLLIGALVIGVFEIGKWITAEKDLEEIIDEKAEATKKDVDETEKSINTIKQEITARKSAETFIDAAIKSYLDAADAQSKETEGSKEWAKQAEIMQSRLDQLGKLFGEDAIARIKESKDKAKAFETEKKSYVDMTDKKVKKLKELNDKLVTYYQNRITEFNHQAEIYQADLNNFGHWSWAQLEGLSILDKAWALFYQHMYNNAKKKFDELETQIKPYMKELQSLIEAGSGDSPRANWLKNEIKRLDLLQRAYSNSMKDYQKKGTEDVQRELKESLQKHSELIVKQIEAIAHGDEVKPIYDHDTDPGAIEDDEESESGSSKDNRTPMEYYGDDFMQAMAAIAHQKGVDFKTSQIWALAGLMSGNGDPWVSLNSRTNNPFNINRDFMNRYYPAGDINDIFDTSRALTEFLKENKGSVKDTFFAFLEAMFPNLSKDEIKSKVQSVIDEADYLDTLYNFDKNLDDVRPRAKSNTYTEQLQKPAGQSTFDFNPADLETSRPSAEAVYKYLRHYGYDHNAAKGWIVNISSESGLRADNVNSDSGAFGLYQFYADRKDRFFDWANQNNRDPYSALSQLDYARLIDIPERGSVAGMASYTDDFYIVPVPKVKDFSPESMNGRSAIETSYIYKTRFEHPGEPYPDEILYEHMQEETSAFGFLDDLESNVERNLDSVGGNVLKMYAQGLNDCTLQATRAIMQAYTGKQYNASDWTFSNWFDDLTQTLKADYYDLSPNNRETFESIIKDHFDQFPDRPVMLYQGRGAGSAGNHKINSYSGTHATIIGRKLDNGKYQIFDSAGSVTHELDLSEIIDMSAYGDPNNGIDHGNMLIIPTVAPSNPITSWQIESGNAVGNTYNSRFNQPVQSVAVPNIRETNLGLNTAVDPQRKSGIVLHHTDANGDVFSVDATHRNEFGWAAIGYHFLINKDGTIDRGRPEDRIGAHAKGHNVGNLGIALAGKYHNVEDIPEAQWNSLVSLVAYLCKKYNIDPKNITGHRDHNATDCPGDTVYYRFPELIQSVLNAESQPVVNPSYSSIQSNSGNLDSYWTINDKDFNTRRNSLSSFRVNPVDSILKQQHDLDNAFQSRRQQIQNSIKLNPDDPKLIQDERNLEKSYLENLIQNRQYLENIQDQYHNSTQRFLNQHPEIQNTLNRQNSSWDLISTQEKIDLAKRAGDEAFVDIINQEDKLRQAVIETNKKFEEQKQKILEMRDILSPEQIEDLELKNLQNIFELQSVKNPDDPTIERSYKRAQLAILRKRLMRQQDDLKKAESSTDETEPFDEEERIAFINNRSKHERKVRDGLSKTQNEIAALEQSLKDLSWLDKKSPFEIMKSLEDSKLSQLDSSYQLNQSQNLFDDRLLERFYQRKKLDVLNQRLLRLKLEYSKDIQKDNDEKDRLLAEIELNQKNLDTLKQGTNEFETQREKLDILKTKLENVGLEEKESLKNLRETEIEINSINRALDDRKYISEQIAKIDSYKIQRLDDDFKLYQTDSKYQSPSIEHQYLNERLALLETQKSHQQNDLQNAIADRMSRENVINEQIHSKLLELGSSIDSDTVNRLQAEIDDLKKELDFMRQFGTDDTRSAQNALNQTNLEISNTKKTIKDNYQQYREDYENQLLESARLDFENESAGQLFDDGSRGKDYARRKLAILYQRQSRLQSEYQDAKTIGDIERSVIRDKLNEQSRIVANTTDVDELERQKALLGQLQAEYARLSEIGTDAEINIANQMKETTAQIKETTRELDPIGTELAQALGSGIQTMFSDILLEGKSFSDAWKNLWSGIAQIALRQLVQIGLSKVGISFASGGFVGYKEGGLINESLPRFGTGGDILGGGIIRGFGTGKSDSILTYLAHRGKFIRTSDGEYIIKQDTVEKLGVPFLDMLNDHPEAMKPLKAFANGGNLGEEMIPSMSTNLQSSYKNFTKSQSEKESYDSRLERLMTQQNGLLSQYSQPIQQTTNMNINAVDSKSFVQLLNRHSDVLVALLRKEQSRRNTY